MRTEFVVRWLLWACALLPLAGYAVQVDDLFKAEVEVADQSNSERKRAFREGLAEVLVKVSGRSSVMTEPMVAESLAKAGAYDEALQEFELAIEGDATMHEAYCLKGSVLKNNSKLKEAEAALKRCLKGSPRHPEAHKWMGFIHKDNRRTAEAIKSFEYHLRTNPDDIDAELVRDEVKALKRK